jgi:hypothetical protein
MSQETIANLDDALAQLLGKVCWDAIVPDGELLQLEIGDHVAIDGSPRGVEVGEWGMIVSRGEWAIRDVHRNSLVTSSEIAAKIGSIGPALKAITGEIVAIEMRRYDLSLAVEFGNGSSLELATDNVTEGETTWELFTPDEMMFVARGGGKVDYVRSDVR